MIEKYSFGKIVVNGVTYTSDIKIVQGRVVSDWWRKKGYSVGAAARKRGFCRIARILLGKQSEPDNRPFQNPDSRRKNPNTGQRDI
jgi:hypothetical protein